jgi:hypothetical protein
MIPDITKDHWVECCRDNPSGKLPIIKYDNLQLQWPMFKFLKETAYESQIWKSNNKSLKSIIIQNTTMRPQFKWRNYIPQSERQIKDNLACFFNTKQPS